MEDTVRGSLRTYPTTDFQRYENHSIKPPTYIKTNEFTEVFQEIVNTYGIPMHKEINPAVFAIVTFPFLFGVMFGDVGHGLLLMIGGIILCLLSDKLRQNPAMEAFLSMRYIILMMGFFATFNGLVYNEFFAIPMHIWGESCYTEDVMVLSVIQNTTTKISDDISKFGYNKPVLGCVYPFGMDPRWYQSDQLLSYTNNFKMKLAVIFAIIQMCMGILMKGLNAIHFRNKLDFFLEFVPQMLLMLALFGWMDILIIAKWLEEKDVNTNFPLESEGALKIGLSPAIITTMIDMFLKGASNTKPNSDPPVFGYNYVFFGETQQVISLLCLIIAFVSVPVMLYVKPMILKKRMEAAAKDHVDVHQEKIEYTANLTSGTVYKGGNSEHYDQIKTFLDKEGTSNEHTSFGDIFIHQLIETIEFVLGTVSNTASYLRLWALSLAHSQLATVFLELILVKYGGGFHTHNPIASSIMVSLKLLL